MKLRKEDKYNRICKLLKPYSNIIEFNNRVIIDDYTITEIKNNIHEIYNIEQEY